VHTTEKSIPEVKNYSKPGISTVTNKNKKSPKLKTVKKTDRQVTVESSGPSE
jgi:hypothetical protein